MKKSGKIGACLVAAIMAVSSALVGMILTMYISTPVGPTIVVVDLFIFIASFIVGLVKR